MGNLWIAVHKKDVTMKPKRLFQTLVLLALLFSPFGSNQPARASADLSAPRDVNQDQPSVSMTISPANVNPGENTLVTVRLNNVPAEGYSSAEITCIYNPGLVAANNIVVGDLFGIDPAVAINGPQDGRFIAAIAGSDGRIATGGGTVIVFNLQGIQPGQSPLECRARVSWADNKLINIYSIPASLTVLGGTLTPTFEPTACDKAEFIADISVPPGTVMSPGAQFIKRWRLKNVGSCVWTTSYRLALLSGEQMGAPSSIQFPANVAPGQTVDLSLPMTAPSIAGSYRGYWIFQNATGVPFGVGSQGNQPWFVDITVSGATLTASPTAMQSPTPSITPSGPTPTPSPSPTITATPTTSGTPGAPTGTPIAGTVFDFTANAFEADWLSGAGLLPFPGIDGNPNGFAYIVNSPRLETGATAPRPGLLTVPQNVQNGYIQGFYPPFHVQTGDRFRTILSCESGATSCYAAYRMDYQVGGESIKTIWGPWLERYEGQVFTVDVDLSPLAGKDVKFILTVLAGGVATGDRMLWVDPVIYRRDLIPTATSEPTGTPTITPEEPPVDTPTPGNSPTPTVTPIPGTGTITGRVLAGKPVTLDLLDAGSSPVATVVANGDGTFSLTAPAGTYNIVAHAPGFLSAMGPVTVTNGNPSTLPDVLLLAGDIDNNSMIDQFDALTIGMNYNTALPSAADLNNDGTINVLDLELLARNYRSTGPVPW